MNSQSASKKYALVTGATAGLGEAIAERFALEGWNVIITGRRADRLKKLKDSLTSKYQVEIIDLEFDIRDRGAVIAAVQELKKRVPHVDVLVNNAGLAAGLAPIHEGDPDDWDTMIDTNIKGLLYMTRQVAPWMKDRGVGHIFNIGSIAGKLVYENGNVYCATKFAVDALSQAMRIDLLPYGIKVTGIHPGMVETEFSLVRYKGDAERAGKVYEGIIPLAAADIADTVWYCTNQPPHVCINDLTITCLAQASPHYTIRTSK